MTREETRGRRQREERRGGNEKEGGYIREEQGEKSCFVSSEETKGEEEAEKERR